MAMASSSSSSSVSQLISHVVALHPYPIQSSPHPHPHPPSFIHFHSPTKHFTLKCTTSPNTSPQDLPNTSPADLPNPFPDSQSATTNDNFPIEKRRRSAIIREKRTGLVKPEPPNFEIGWKRTKHIPLEKKTGYVIMDFLEKLEDLMGKEYGSTSLLEKVGEIVAERVREEAEELRDDGKVEERMVTELFRVLKLMEMDLAMVKAAVKEETLNQRLEQAKARCRQAILVANSF